MSWIHETHEDVAAGALKDAYARVVSALGRVIPFYRAYSVSPAHLDAHHFVQAQSHPRPSRWRVSLTPIRSQPATLRSLTSSQRQ
jgi:hypothetical protein